jgi:hypothetical protein
MHYIIRNLIDETSGMGGGGGAGDNLEIEGTADDVLLEDTFNLLLE